MLTIQWLGQSGYLLEDGKRKVVIDPYLSDAVFKNSGKARLVKAPVAPEELEADVYICTHDHRDHLDPDTIPVIRGLEKTVFLAPSAAGAHLAELGAKEIRPFDEGTEYAFGDFTVRAVFADHGKTPAIGVLLIHEGKKLLFSGDTYYHERLKESARFFPDLLFICINGKLGNMNVDEAVKLTHEISPKVGIPGHYGMFAENTEDPEKYLSRVSPSFRMEHARVYELSEILK